MDQSPQLEQIIQNLAELKTAAIFIPQNPNLDIIAASLSLFLSLGKAGKNLSVVCSSPMTVGFSRLVGVNRISTKIGGRSLVVAFDYLENAIDKVSYNIENKKFNLVIQPKAGFSPLSSKNVHFSYSGDLETVVIIGASSLDKLGPIYQQESGVFSQSSILNIGISSDNTHFGKTNALFPGASSYSEIMALLIESASYPIDQDIANNLLFGLQSATNNFVSPQTTPEAFAAAAFCLRAGGRRQPPAIRRPKGGRSEPRPLALTPMSKGASAIRSPQEEIPEEEGEAAPPVTGKTNKAPSADWYGPKVFHGAKRI